MYQVVTKLKAHKQHLKGFNRDNFSNVETSAMIALKQLEYIQEQLSGDPLNPDLIQKAKTAWIKDGDFNTKYFHGVIKSRQMKNQVLQIKDRMGNNCVEPQDIQNAFLEYYKWLLGTETITIPVNRRIVGRDVTQFRPIACCNTLYKIISKLISARLGDVLPDLSYDSVSWKFVEEMLEALDFPAHFRELIMLCVTTASFLISLNGFLNVLLMIYDLLMFTKGDLKSIMVLHRAFSSFSHASGLNMNAMKSCAYFNGMSKKLRDEILSVWFC
ncbi:uncharacterized protein LOC141620576 [Silene latifolia]|uniref:uncharacterized protein LOC141620576 n=1 Tax=Silene latifolia TaxID=37657 RepID=UPI003D779384